MQRIYQHIPLRLRAALRLFRISRVLAVALTVAAVFSGIATYGVITHNEGAFGPDPRHALSMVIINLVLVLALTGLISYKIVKLWLARKHGKVGSRLQVRMIMMFCLVAVIPTVIITVFSGIFFNYGIQSWFNNRVGQALDASVAVAEGYLREHKDNIRADILAMANDVNKNSAMILQSPATFKQFLATQATLRNLSEALVFRGRDVLARTEASFSLMHDLEDLSPELLEQANEGEVVILTSEEDQRVRALIKINALYDIYMLVGRPVDSSVLEHMEQTTGAVAEYQRLRSNIGSIQIQFFTIFIGVAFLLLLAAIWAGLILAGEIVHPLGTLIGATEKVKAGQLNTRVPEGPQHDEIATLGRAFNEMTDQLKKQRKQLMEANRQTEMRRRLMEAVLSGVEAGVVAINPDRQVTLFNRAAPDILGMPANRLKGMDILALMPEVRPILERALTAKEKVIQDQLVIDRGRRKTFLVRIVREESDSIIEGYVMTFDDITDLLTAQRTAAWGDVARRIAHEIKNPLTPITLSTERLKRKYSGMFTDDAERENFERYIDTISRHVNTIRTIVDEFVNFARMPAPVMSKMDVAALVREMWLVDKSLHTKITYHTVMKDRLKLMVNADSGQLTQVFTNLFKNAREALEARIENGDATPAELTLTMQVEDNQVHITLDDNGTGFPPDLIDRITEPYVTTREKGTGLGLAIVKKVITDHEGTFHIENRMRDEKILGARVMIMLPLCA